MITPSLSESLMHRGVTPRDEVVYKTTCPECSPYRRKRNQKCLRVEIVDPDTALLRCYHCGLSDVV